MSGMGVFPRPGHLHCVMNRRACVKLAFDHFVPEHGLAYLESWRRVLKSTRTAPDYIGVLRVVYEVCCRWIRSLALGVRV